MDDTRLSLNFFDFLSNSAGMLDFMELPGGSSPLASTRSIHSSSNERASIIPTERFAEVSRLWPDKMGASAVNKFAANLWAEVVAHPGDNICTDTSVKGTSPASTIGDSGGSGGYRWGIDEDKYQALIDELARECRGGGVTIDGEPLTVRFPPMRLLNLGLDIAFRQPHCLLPFIHQPTFSVKSSLNSIVFPLCLLGLAMLDSKHVRHFTNGYLPVSIPLPISSPAWVRCEYSIANLIIDCHRPVSKSINPAFFRARWNFEINYQPHFRHLAAPCLVYSPSSSA
jgi:hypothetical protein